MITESRGQVPKVRLDHRARRLLAAYRELGAGALAHGNRGRRPRNVVSEAVAAAVGAPRRTRYPGANHTHLASPAVSVGDAAAPVRSTHRPLSCPSKP